MRNKRLANQRAKHLLGRERNNPSPPNPDEFQEDWHSDYYSGIELEASDWEWDRMENEQYMDDYLYWYLHGYERYSRSSYEASDYHQFF